MGDPLRCLLGEKVSVVLSPNRSQINLKGIVCYEKSNPHGYVILYHKGQYKMIEKGLLKGDGFVLNLNYRNMTQIKELRRKITLL